MHTIAREIFGLENGNLIAKIKLQISRYEDDIILYLFDSKTSEPVLILRDEAVYLG